MCFYGGGRGERSGRLGLAFGLIEVVCDGGRVVSSGGVYFFFVFFYYF